MVLILIVLIPGHIRPHTSVSLFFGGLSQLSTCTLRIVHPRRFNTTRFGLAMLRYDHLVTPQLVHFFFLTYAFGFIIPPLFPLIY